MKRIISSLLLIVLCLGCIGSFAEEGKEITFMDIPWLSTPEEFNDLYYGSGRHSAEGFLKTLDRERQKQKLVKSEFAFDPEDETCPYTARSKQFEPITGKLYRLQLYSQGQNTKFLFDGQFAGLTVSFTNCYFTADPEDPRFVMFCIFFDREIGKKELVAALKEVFGEPAGIKSKGLCYIWLGANNTAAILHCGVNELYLGSIDGLKLAESIEIP